jgi:hypothetical protein
MPILLRRIGPGYTLYQALLHARHMLHVPILIAAVQLFT